MDVLLLRLDAPLMSFGGVIIDQHNFTERFPGVSLLTGLFANALGYSHGEAEHLQALQTRIVYAARWDVPPEVIVDYHTVDLGQPKLVDTGWTTRGQREDRKGGTASEGTHIRYRHYLANGVMTLAMMLTGADRPTLTELEQALRRPARPLFLGRKCCLPAAPLVLGRVEAGNLKTALREAPRHARADPQSSLLARWPVSEGADKRGESLAVYDWRDWRNQVHTGQRRMIEGLLP